MNCKIKYSYEWILNHIVLFFYLLNFKKLSANQVSSNSIQLFQVLFFVFNGMSTFMSQSHPCRRTAAIIFNPLLEDKGVHIFPKGIYPKVNIIVWLVFELVYYNLAVQQLFQDARQSFTFLVTILFGGK